MPDPIPTQWRHEEPRTFTAAIADAMDRARIGDWAEAKYGDRAIADQRALVVASLCQIGDYSTRLPYFDAAAMTLHIGERVTSEFASAERLALANALSRTWKVAHKNGRDLGLPNALSMKRAQSFETSGGGAPTKVLDAGWHWAAVAGVALLSVGWIWTTQASEETTRTLARERTARMLSTHAETLKVFEAHRQRELAGGGAALPFTDAERQTLAVLVSAQDAAERGDAAHDQQIRKGGLLGGLLGDGGPGTALGATLGTVEMLALAAVAYVALKNG